MKERSGKDSKVEFQSGKNKKTPLPKPRPKSIKKQEFMGMDKPYSNPSRKPMMTEQKKAPIYTGKVYNPEPKAPKPKNNLPLSGKKKRMDKGRSRLNPFVTYENKKKKTKPPLKFKSPAGNKGGSDALYRVPQLSKNKKKKIKT
tara:strand:+ start:121 stop:552 length:432 start_codon:yes stop_codon:yes gene_type:complete